MIFNYLSRNASCKVTRTIDMNLCFPYIIKDHYLLKESVVRTIVKRTDVSFYCCHRSCLEGTGSSSEASFLTVTNNALGCCWNAWKSWRGCTYVWSEVFILYQSCSRNCLFEELELGVCERFFSSCLRADPRAELPYFVSGIFANFCKSMLFFAHFCASERA